MRAMPMAYLVKMPHRRDYEPSAYTRTMPPPHFRASILEMIFTGAYYDNIFAHRWPPHGREGVSKFLAAIGYRELRLQAKDDGSRDKRP